MAYAGPAQCSIARSLGWSPNASTPLGADPEPAGQHGQRRRLGHAGRGDLQQAVARVGVRDRDQVAEQRRAPPRASRRRCSSRRGRAAWRPARRAGPPPWRDRLDVAGLPPHAGTPARARTTRAARPRTPPPGSALAQPRDDLEGERRVEQEPVQHRLGVQVVDERAVGADRDAAVPGRLDDGRHPARRSAGDEHDRQPGVLDRGRARRPCAPRPCRRGARPCRPGRWRPAGPDVPRRCHRPSRHHQSRVLARRGSRR